MSGLIFLQMSLRMRQMAGSGGIATADGAFLEVSLENITPRKRIPTENTHIWAVAGVLKVKSASIKSKAVDVRTYVGEGGVSDVSRVDMS